MAFRVITKLLKLYAVNQWKYTESVIIWFVNISIKNSSMSVASDIDSFFSLIWLEVFNNKIKLFKGKM